MQRALRRRETILEAVSFAATRFLGTTDWEDSIRDVLARLGQATGVSRVYVFENHVGQDDGHLTNQRHEWVAPGIAPQIDKPELQGFPLWAEGFARWEDTLERGEAVCGHVREFPESEQEVLASQDIKSIVVVPIFLGEERWGSLGFDECVAEREWSVAEVEALKTAADILSGAIQHRRAWQALRESEKRFRDIADNAVEWIWQVDADGKYTYASPVVERILGYRPEEMLEKHFYDSFHPEDREELKKAAFEAFAQKEPFREFVNRNIHKNGKVVWLSTSGVPILDEHGNLLGYRGADTDISERKQMEGALLAKTQEYIDTINLTGDIMGRLDAHGRWTLLNDAACQFFGRPREELLGTDARASVHPEDLETTVRAVEEAAARREPIRRFVNRQVTPMGTRVVEWNAYPLFDGEGHYAAIQMTGRDITDREQALEALRESEEKYRRLVQDSADGIVIFQGLEVRFVNQALVRMYGAESSEEIVGRPFTDFVSPEHRELMLGRARARQKGGNPPSQYEFKAQRKDGTEVDAEASVSTITYQGKPAVQGIIRDITERKQMEEALRESEERHRAIFEQAADSIVLVDAETGAVVQFNDRAHQALGYTREEFGKLKIPDFEVIESPQEVAKHIQKIVKRGADTFETNHRTKSGEIRNIAVSTRAISIGGRDLIQSIFHDITERKHMEKALRESEGRYRLLAENASDVIWTMDLSLRYTYMSPAITRERGYSVEEAMAQTVNESMTPASRETALKTLAEELALEKLEHKDLSRSRTLELEMYCKDGSTIWCEMNMTFLRDSDGNPIGILGTTRDITERKQMEEALRESEGRYRLLAENTSDLIWTMDLSLRYTYMSPTITRMRGYSVEEVVGSTVAETMTPTSLEVARKTLAEELAKERMEQKDLHRSRKLELEMYCKDGSTIWTEMNMTFLRDSDGNPIGILGVTRDISERKKAEEALRESEERYRLIAENASDLIWTMDLNLRYTYMSPSVERMRGYSADEIVGTRLNETMTPASLEAVRKAFTQEIALEKKERKDLFRSRTLESEMYCKDGSTIWTEIKMTFLRDSDGRPIGILGVTRDISERKKAERERQGLHAELEVRAITDSLTGLYDHAQFYRRLAEEIERAKRYNQRFAVVMMDVDNFKRFNDSSGHQAGDRALRLVGYCIRSGLRRSDLAFRYGGDEFAAILPHTDSSRAQAVVNRINRRITKSLKQTDDEAAGRLSLSAGVACFPNDGTTADDLVRMADAALYSAKWVARARDIMGQREDIQSLVSALVSRRAGVEGPPSGAIFRPEALHEQHARIVASVASSIAVALKDAGVSQALEDPDLQIVAVVGAAAEIKDRYIRGHPERTSEEAVALAEEMGLPPERVRDIRIAGLLHDLGKVTVSEGILNKPGKLTRREFAIIKEHPIVGATIVSQVRRFARLVPIIRHHHERFDGEGYPDGLAGENIPLEARILSVVDVFDALTHERAYRQALSSEEAIGEIERGTGTQFDPKVAKAFLALMNRRAEELAAPTQAASEDRQLAAGRAAGRGKG